jgi:hypothetical protein
VFAAGFALGVVRSVFVVPHCPSSEYLRQRTG